MSDKGSTENRDTEEMSSQPSSSPSSSPRSSSYLPSLLRAGTGVALGTVVAVRLIPALLGFLKDAQHAPCGGWEKWIPSLVVGAILVVVVAPTSPRELAALVTAVKGILPGARK